MENQPRKEKTLETSVDSDTSASLKCYLIEDYFVTPQLADLWRKVFEHPQFGDGIRVIEGGNGVGKTMMAYAMVGKFDEREAVSHLELHQPIKLTRLLDGLSMEFGLPLKDDTPAGQQMANLRNYHHQLIQNGRRAFVIIDNAQYLDTTALSALMSVKQQSSNEGYGLNYFLFASPNFAKKLDQLGFPDIAVYDFSVPLFTEAEMQQFLHDYAKRHKIDVPELRSDLAKGGSLFARIHLGSLGSPGLALRLFETLVDELSPKGNELESLIPNELNSVAEERSSFDLANAEASLGDVQQAAQVSAGVEAATELETAPGDTQSSNEPKVTSRRSFTVQDSKVDSEQSGDGIRSASTKTIPSLKGISSSSAGELGELGQLDEPEKVAAKDTRKSSNGSDEHKPWYTLLPTAHILVVAALIGFLVWWIQKPAEQGPSARISVDIPASDALTSSPPDSSAAQALIPASKSQSSSSANLPAVSQSSSQNSEVSVSNSSTPKPVDQTLRDSSSVNARPQTPVRLSYGSVDPISADAEARNTPKGSASRKLAKTLTPVVSENVYSPGSAFLQLIAGYDQSYIEAWYRDNYPLGSSLALGADLWLVESRRRDRSGRMVPWHAILYGPFESSSVARTHVKQLERIYSSSGAFIKTSAELKRARFQVLR